MNDLVVLTWTSPRDVGVECDEEGVPLVFDNYPDALEQAEKYSCSYMIVRLEAE